MSRPEHTGPPENFYNATEAKKYAGSSRMRQIQAVISERALELLNLPPGPKLLLDVGCGTGLSGAAMEEYGHTWLGMDISRDMLEVGAEEMEEGSSGDFAHQDMGQGCPVRGGVFDGAISISAVQWLCYASSKADVPRLRLRKFFQELYNSLSRGARAVIQLYPETPQQMEMISNAAMSAGFTGGLVVDYPNSAKAKKYYLVLMTGTAKTAGSSSSHRVAAASMPTALGDGSATSAHFESGRQSGKKRGHDREPAVKSRGWVRQKKARQERQGKEVRADTKYTGRRRKPGW